MTAAGLYTVEDGFLIESIKAQVFDKVDPVALDIVHLDTELHTFAFFAPDDWTDIIFVDTDDQIFYFPAKKTFLLLQENLFAIFIIVILLEFEIWLRSA